jgi:hypothetical protein
MTPEELKAAYEAGATIEELALDEGRSTQWMRKQLHDAGTVIRKPGAQQGKPRNQANANPKTERPTGVRGWSRSSRRRQGKRSRGR